jgi:hypothetical protein
MAAYASRITADENCGFEYRATNPVVVQAFMALSAYMPLYRAGCLKDTDGAYCFAKAISNSTASSMDSWPYFIPLGISLPPGTRTSCSSCVQDTMVAFSVEGGVFRTQYLKSAEQLNSRCEANWLPLTFKASLSSASRNSYYEGAYVVSVALAVIFLSLG